MRQADLELILKDVERVAAAAEQLLRSTSAGAAQATATPPPPGTLATTRKALRTRPWRTLGVATALGFLIGCMLARGPRRS